MRWHCIASCFLEVGQTPNESQTPHWPGTTPRRNPLWPRRPPHRPAPPAWGFRVAAPHAAPALSVAKQSEGRGPQHSHSEPRDRRLVITGPRQRSPLTDASLPCTTAMRAQKAGSDCWLTEPTRIRLQMSHVRLCLLVISRRRGVTALRVEGIGGTS